MTVGRGTTVLAALLAIACSRETKQDPVPAVVPGVPTSRTYLPPYGAAYFDDLALTAGGGFVFAADTGSSDAIVFEADAAGAIVWQWRFDAGLTDIPTSVRPVSGGFVVAGDSGSGPNRAFLMKLDATGAILWKKTYGYLARGTLGAVRREVVVRPAPDGGYVLATTDERYANANYQPRAWVAKLDASGEIVWQYSYGDLWTLDGDLRALEPTSDGGFVLAGVDTRGFLLAKIGGDGALLWARRYADAGRGAANAVREVPGVGYVVAGYREDPGTLVFQPTLVAVDGAGALLWQRGWGGAESAVATDFAADADRGFLVAGWARVASLPRLFALKVDAAGAVLWQRTYGDGTDGGSTAGSVSRLPDGRWRLAGTRSQALWVLDVAADGAIAFPGGSIPIGSAGLAPLPDTLAAGTPSIGAIATSYAATTSSFVASPAGLTATQDAP